MAHKRLAVHKIGTTAKEMSLGQGTRTFHLPQWSNLTHPQRLKVIRQIAMMRGRDPRIAKLAVSALRKAGAKPREYEKQAAALLAWIQNPKNFYFVNEPGERLQDPIYTIKVKAGDCDDAVILLAALFESIGLPWRLVLSGRDQANQKLRYIEGSPVPQNVRWAHIYLAVGTPAFKPTTWYFCEPTIQGVPLGWDVIAGDASYLPEMARHKPGPVRLAVPGRAPVEFTPKKLPARLNRSPAYDMAYGQAHGQYEQAFVGGAIGSSIASSEDAPSQGHSGAESNAFDWTRIGTAVITGVAVSITTALFLDWVNGKGLWGDQGHVLARWGKAAEPTVEESIFAAPPPI